MKSSRWFVLVCMVAVLVAPAIGQEAPRLLFEVTVDGSLVARPEMRVPSGGQGRLELDERRGDVRVLFTPTVRADDVSITFDITGGGREAKPTLVVSKAVPASIVWVSPATGQEVRIQISFAPTRN